jgi:hypothetical protein
MMMINASTLLPARSSRLDRPAGAQGIAHLPGGRPQISKQVADREGLYVTLDLRRRRAQIAARHASEGVGGPVAARLARAS